MKLQYKSSLIMFVFGSAFLIALSVIYYFQSRNFTLKNYNHSSRRIAENIAAHVEIHLKEKAKIAITLSNTNNIKQALTLSNSEFDILTKVEREQKITKLNEKWKETKNVTDPFIQTYMTNPIASYLRKQQEKIPTEYGEIFLTNRYGAMIATTAQLTTLAHAHKYWWIASYYDGKGRIFFDDRGFDKSVKGYVLGVVVPIMDESKVIGILKCNLNIIGALNQILGDFKGDRTAILKLVRSGGEVVFEKGREPLSTRISDIIVGRMKKWTTDSKVVDDNGIHNLFTYAPIPFTQGSKEYGFGGSYKSIDHIKGNTGDGWFILISKDLDEILIASDEMTKRIIGIGLLFILLMAIVALFFGKKISHPVIELAHFAKKIGQGDFQTKIDVSSKDEIGILADSFNEMSMHLKEITVSRDKLEREISVRKQTEEELRESEERFRTLFEFAPDAYYMNDLEGNFIDGNRTAEDLLGYKREELVGKNFFELDLLPVEELQKATELLVKNMEGKPTGPDEFNIKRKDGRQVAVETRTIPIDIGGKDVVLGIARDVSERKQAERERIQREKLQSVIEIAGAICHEMSQPMQAILGNSELLLMDISEDDAQYAYSKTIKEQIDRMGKITKKLMTLTKYETRDYLKGKIIDIDKASKKGD